MNLEHQFPLICFLVLFSSVKFFFRDVLKHVRWLHMHDFLFLRRISGSHRFSTYAVIIFSVTLLNCHGSTLSIDKILRLMIRLLRLLIVLRSSIMLRLAWKGHMLRDDLTIAVSYRWTSTLFECTKVVIVCIFIHGAHILFDLFLLCNTFLLIFLVYLVLENVFIIVSLLLTLYLLIRDGKRCTACVYFMISDDPLLNLLRLNIAITTISLLNINQLLHWCPNTLYFVYTHSYYCSICSCTSWSYHIYTRCPIVLPSTTISKSLLHGNLVRGIVCIR